MCKDSVIAACIEEDKEVKWAAKSINEIFENLCKIQKIIDINPIDNLNKIENIAKVKLYLKYIEQSAGMARTRLGFQEEDIIKNGD